MSIKRYMPIEADEKTALSEVESLRVCAICGENYDATSKAQALHHGRPQHLPVSPPQEHS